MKNGRGGAARKRVFFRFLEGGKARPQGTALMFFICFVLACPPGTFGALAADPHAGHGMANGTAPSPHQGRDMSAREASDPHAAHRMSAQEVPDPHAAHRMSAQEASDPHAAHRMSSDGASPDAGRPGPASSPSMAASPAPSGSADPFAVAGRAPAGVPIASNAVPPPEMKERLGESVPEGIIFTDDAGRSLDVRSLMDVPTVVAPIFLNCPGGCNTLQSSLAATLPGVNLAPGRDFRVLVVSFDETDAPALAARKKANYLAAMNYTFPEKELVYLTGEAGGIRRFMDSLGFPFIRLGPGNFSHPLGLIVLAPGGEVVRYLYGQSFMPFDLTMALTEASEGKTGLSIKRAVAYCFTYDPAARGYVFNFMRVAGAIILFGSGVFLFILLRSAKKRQKVQKS